MKISKSTTANMFAIILTIGVFVLAWKFVLPNYFSHKNSLISLQSEVDAAKAKLASLDQAKTDIASVRGIADQIMVSVPKGQDEPNLISELEAIGIKNSIAIPSMDISEPEAAQTATGSVANDTGVVAQTAAAPATVTEGANNAISGDTSGATGVGTATSSGPFTVSFTVTGTFENLNSFMVGLEKSIRFMNIKSLTYEVPEDGGNSLALQIEVYQQ